jgi:choline dehydrogenase-like flavoprotein
MIDVLIVGSGPGGVNVAYPLCEEGLNVLMLDYGNTDEKYKSMVPSNDFMQIRKTNALQHRFFLGDDFEGILLGDIRVGSKLTPPRLHVLADAPELVPVESDTFVAHQSLAIGGLADAWGAGVLPFHIEDFSDMPISLADLEHHYRIVAARIGISCADDDLKTIFKELDPAMPPLDIDTNAETILNKYNKKKDQFNRQGFFMGRAPLAVCSQKYRGRGPHQYHDMDYWTDTDDSVYRPRYTLEELRKFPNFSYIKNRLVSSFKESGNTVEVTVTVRNGSRKERYQTRALVLCAGALGSARIAIRSLNKYDFRIPVLTNAYTYIPSINFNMLGKIPRDRRSSLAQLSVVFFCREKKKMPVLSNFFSYRSLLTFKLLKEAPLPQRECLRIMRLLMPYFSIITIFHRDYQTPEKYCILRKSLDNQPDRMEIQYRLSDKEIEDIEYVEKRIKQFYRNLGCWPLKSIRRAPGSSIHYSGTLPMSKEERVLTCDTECRLHGTKAVYVADASVISPLPSIVPTFSVMANANRVGTLLAKKFKSWGH